MRTRCDRLEPVSCWGERNPTLVGLLQEGPRRRCGVEGPTCCGHRDPLGSTETRLLRHRRARDLARAGPSTLDDDVAVGMQGLSALGEGHPVPRKRQQVRRRRAHPHPHVTAGCDRPQQPRRRHGPARKLQPRGQDGPHSTCSPDIPRTAGRKLRGPGLVYRRREWRPGTVLQADLEEASIKAMLTGTCLRRPCGGRCRGPRDPWSACGKRQGQ